MDDGFVVALDLVSELVTSSTNQHQEEVPVGRVAWSPTRGWSPSTERTPPWLR